MKLRVPPQPGRRVDPPAGAGFAHEHVRADGTTIVVLRDQRGRLLPGNRLVDLRVAGTSGNEARNPDSVARAALGLPSRWEAADERKRAKRNGGAR